MDLLSKMMAFEDGELGDGEILELFSELIKTGAALTLQGFYGRTATRLIRDGWLNDDGSRTWNRIRVNN